MQKKYGSVVFFSIIVILFVFAYAHVGTATPRDNLTDLENELEANQESQSMLEEEMSDIEESKSALENLVSGLNSELAIINGQIAELQGQMIEKESEILTIQEEVVLAKELESQQYQDMKKRIQYMFEMGESSYLEIMLSEGSIVENLNRAEFVSQLVSYDRKKLDEYKFVRAAVLEKEETLTKEKEALKELEAKAREQQLLIAAKIQDTNEKIKAYADDLAAAEQAALEYEKQAEANRLAIEEESRRIEESSILEAESIERASREQASREKASREQASREQASREQASRDQENGVTGEQSIPETESMQEAETTEAYEEETYTPYENTYVPVEGDLDMMAALIECEAGDQEYYGMLCVGAVVMNRINSSRFPNTLYEVLYQPYQFSPVTVSNRFSIVLARGANEECYRAAREVLIDGKIVGGWLFFRMNDGSREGEIIGDHVFY
jgi:peptidoglycan hydrolase CwlO-like protein